MTPPRAIAAAARGRLQQAQQRAAKLGTRAGVTKHDVGVALARVGVVRDVVRGDSSNGGGRRGARARVAHRARRRAVASTGRGLGIQLQM